MEPVWSLEGVGVFRDNDLIASGIAADILGGPLKSLRWLIGHLIAGGGGLKAGVSSFPVPLLNSYQSALETRFQHDSPTLEA